MPEILNRFSPEAAKLSGLMAFVLLFIWLTVVGCAFSSLRSQTMTKKQFSFWLLVIICVPLLGLLSYLPFSVLREHYPEFFNNKKND